MAPGTARTGRARVRVAKDPPELTPGFRVDIDDKGPRH
jgi:hypothetical protein